MVIIIIVGNRTFIKIYTYVSWRNRNIIQSMVACNFAKYKEKMVGNIQRVDLIARKSSWSSKNGNKWRMEWMYRSKIYVIRRYKTILAYLCSSVSIISFACTDVDLDTIASQMMRFKMNCDGSASRTGSLSKCIRLRAVYA